MYRIIPSGNSWGVIEVARDYYTILGVSKNAQAEQIKAAYRQKVKEFHPDYYGQDSAPFRAIQEAYDVLSDPAQRRAYDATLVRPGGRPQPDSWTWPEPLRPASSPVEPLAPHPGGSFWGHPAPPFSSGFDEGWTWPEPPSDPPDRPDQALRLRVTISPAEARRGGGLPVLIPVQENCPVCAGWGRSLFYRCRPCAGRGFISVEYPLLLTFPAGVSAGDTYRVSLADLGLKATLVVRFAVEPGQER